MGCFCLVDAVSLNIFVLIRYLICTDFRKLSELIQLKMKIGDGGVAFYLCNAIKYFCEK